MSQEGPMKEFQPMADPDVPEIYANNVQIFGSLFDFLFAFGVMSGPHGKMKPVMNLRMSPQHTKMLCEMLKTQLVEYEKSFGEINLKNKRPKLATKPN